jgi:prophage maintenance system killer protein
MKIIESKSYFLDLNCVNIKVSTNEAVQSIYSLTKVLEVDKDKLTDPVF